MHNKQGSWVYLFPRCRQVGSKVSSIAVQGLSLSSPVAGLTDIYAGKAMPDSQQYGMLKLQKGFRLLARRNCSRVQTVDLHSAC